VINPINIKLILLSFVLLSACENDPLVFSSGTTVGIKVKVSPNESSPVSLAVGYDQVDATLIPTTMDPARQRIASSRSRPVVDKQEAIDNARTARLQLQRNSDPGSQRASKAFSRVIETLSAQPSPAGDPGLVEVPSSVQRDVAEAVSALPPDSPAKAVASEFQAQVGPPGDYQYDSLSVLSTFNLNAEGKAGSAGAQLGKTFATGVAAQNLSDGLGKSLVASAASECLKEANRMQGDALAAAVAACGR